MPLYKTIAVNAHTFVSIWKVEESFETLSEAIVLTPNCQTRVTGMKSDIHRRGFMAVRHLLQASGYTDHDLYYDDFGKPYLTDGKHISITHSFEFAGIIISDAPVGIDIEKQREKIQTIAHKFVGSEQETILSHTTDTDRIRALTILWGAKEALYKSFATAGISFQQHIHIQPFELNMPFLCGTVHYNEQIEHYDITFMEFENFTCVYALPYAF